MSVKRRKMLYIQTTGVDKPIDRSICGLLGIPRREFTKEADIACTVTLSRLTFSVDAVLCF